jgi:hypothetical protein
VASLAYVRAHPELLDGFADELRAARFNSSLVGFTTFQSQAVANGMLRAAAAGQPEAALFERRAKASRRQPLAPPHPSPQPTPTPATTPHLSGTSHRLVSR